MIPITQQFQWAVQALAQPADVQPALFPRNIALADELACDFSESKSVLESNFGGKLSHAQRAAMEALDQFLDEMSGPGKPELWQGDECLNDPKWTKVRQMAVDILHAFNWPPGLPPMDRAIRG